MPNSLFGGPFSIISFWVNGIYILVTRVWTRLILNFLNCCRKEDTPAFEWVYQCFRSRAMLLWETEGHFEAVYTLSSAPTSGRWQPGLLV